MIFYNNQLSTNITTNTVVYNPTASGIQSTLIGLIICNNTANIASATVTMFDGTKTANLVVGVTIPVGTSLNVIDSNKLVVGQGNSINVASSFPVDVTVSAIEVT